MASLGLRPGGGIAGQNPFSGLKIRSLFTGRLPNRVGPISVSGCLPVHETQLKSSTTGGTHFAGPEKFDRWMKDSVVEIVKNLREAPLFVHVYGGDRETRVKTERAVEEDWAHMKGKWVKGEEPSPEGIILVEEINVDDDDDDDGKDGIVEEEEGQNGENTKAWGVLIQGKGEDGGIACYLLKTSKAGGSNLGLFCTHYSLVKVKSFRETAKSQLTNCWLV